MADSSQPASFSFELDASAGLVPVLVAGGSIEFREGGDEETFAEIPAPTVIDASPNAMPSGAVSYSLEPLGQGSWKLTIAVDRDWLAAPDRAWPVTIDPALVTPSVAKDCTISSLPAPEGTKACASASQKSLYAAYIQTEGKAQRSLIRFNTGAIPKNAFVSKATLSLHAPGEAENTPGVEVRRATTTWNEALNWKYANKSSTLWTTPGGDFNTEGAEVLTATRGVAAGWWDFTSSELSELVGKWRADGSGIPNQGLMIKGISESKAECEANATKCARRYVAFDASTATDSTKRPKLSVEYYVRAPLASRLVSPIEGTRSAKRLKLEAAWTATGVTGVSFQYREGSKGVFKNIPTSLVRNAAGAVVSKWPVATEGKKASAPLYFDAAHVSATMRSKGGPIQVRALFDGAVGVEGYSAPINADIDRFIGGPRDGVAEVGPGTVDLLTGNLTVSRTDVSIPLPYSSLDFSRTFNSRDAGKAGDTGVLGQGWKPGIALEESGGSTWKSLRTETFSDEVDGETYNFNYVIATDLEGYELPFLKTGETTYETPPEAAGWQLSGEGAKLVLAEPSGGRTTFELQGSEYLPTSVSQLGGSGNNTRMVYDFKNNQRRLKMIIGPSPATVSCTEANATTLEGCHALTFTYQEPGEWGVSSGLGDRLYQVKYYAPGNGGPWTVAQYKYDPTTGRLKEAWDPRISPNLVEKYTYKTTGQLETITPPGQEPWTLEYGTLDEESDPGRLIAVKRASLIASPSTAQTTIAYDVPVSGGEAPYDMSGTRVGEWGQKQIPVDATAIFPADEVPTKSPPSSYARASVYYLDADGETVNTATPSGAGTTAPSITTSETDQFGNVIRELSPQNRLRSLAAGAGSVTRSEELETKRVYSTDGTEMREEWGPTHQVRLESGTLTPARLHTTIEYDYKAPTPPTGTPMPHLPTRVTTGAAIVGEGIDADQRVTETKYNWELRQPIETIVDPGSGNLNIVSKIAYDAATGLPVESRQPSDPNGEGAGTTKTIYYTAGDGPDKQCKFTAKYAGLPCKVLPAKQPGTAGLPELVVKRFVSYTAFGQPTEIVESPGGSTTPAKVRTTTMTFDGASRPVTKKIDGGGSAVPKVEYLYDSATGNPTTERFKCEPACEDDQAVTTSYDTLGRMTEYKDADGNKSTVSYDLLGRPLTTNDGKGTQTRTYDATSGLLTKLEDSAAGTFTASYDADGNMVEEGLPNGLVAKSTFDETGEITDLVYDKAGSTWLESRAKRSIYGQILKQTGTMSSQVYRYDEAGRLVQTDDTPVGGNCVTRKYKYDVDSNRESLGSLTGMGGTCNTGTDPTPDTYEYDGADRLKGGGIVYDDFGRVENLPGAFAGGSTLTTSYFSTEMVASQTQAGVTNTFQLDAALRQRQRTQGGGLEGVEVFHYGDDSDTPVWTQLGANWSRNIFGIGGGLAAIQDSSSGTLLQLTDLHGDVAATATLSPSATKPVEMFDYDEFGVPQQEGTPQFGWLGGKGRRTEFASGVIQMGVRSYVPSIGRFVSVDPVTGGSASAYDYANADPVNGLDLDGMTAKKKTKGLGGARAVRPGTGSRSKPRTMSLAARAKPVSVPGPTCDFTATVTGEQLPHSGGYLATAKVGWSCTDTVSVVGWIKGGGTVSTPENLGTRDGGFKRLFIYTGYEAADYIPHPLICLKFFFAGESAKLCKRVDNSSPDPR